MKNRADHVIVHTGQHYDELMSDVFFRDLGIAPPDENLDIGSGSHGAQTGAMLIGLEESLVRLRPDWVLVYGDTNSTIAAALAAAKLHLPVAHLEAGLRSFNRRMPEEHNRVLTDHASDLLLAPTAVAMDHLVNEGLSARSVLVGDVMTDVLFDVRDRVRVAPPVLPLDLAPGTYRVATLHRPDNTDDPVRLKAIIDELAGLDAPTLLLVHPRLRALAHSASIPLEQGTIRPIDPLPYPELVSAVLNSLGVITDSGGLQKEAFLLRVPTVTVRPETEWVETVRLGWNVLADVGGIRDAAQRPAPQPTAEEPYGDGRAAHRVVDELLSRDPNGAA
jgi:UDP-N-acetylglucosamine 2-epimerase (non-hydrolysing)